MTSIFMRMLAASLIVHLISVHAACRSEDSVKLRTRLAETLGDINTIAASYVMSVEDVPARPGNRLDEDGHLIWETFSWKHDRNKRWSYFDGEKGAGLNGETQYWRVVYAWNGTDWISYADDKKGALLSSDPWSVLSSQRTVSTLLGDGLFGRHTNDLADILEHGSELESSVLPSGLYRLTCNFNIDLIPSDTYFYQLAVDIDPRHDYLPRKIIVNDRVCEKPVAVIEVTEFAKIDGKRWMPIKGMDTRYQNKYIEDASVNKRLKSAATPRETFEIAKTLDVEYTRKLGAGTNFLSVDPTTLKVNEHFSASEFTFDIPDEAGYVDLRTGESKPLPKPSRPGLGPSGTPSIRLALLVIATVIVGLGAFFLWRSKSGAG